MQTVIDGVLTNYQVLGAKKSPPILILHGWGQNLLNWMDVGNILSRDSKVVLLDLPGFGSSSPPPVKFDTYKYAEFAVKFAYKLNLKNYTLIGHSFGGKIGIIIASRSDNLSRLLLISPSGIDSKTFIIKAKIAIAKTLNTLSNHVTFLKPIRKYIIQAIAPADYKEAGNLIETFKLSAPQRVTKEVKKIKLPTTIIWGEFDKKLPIKMAKTLKNQIKGSTLRVLWSLGHSPNIENPEKLSKVISECL